MSAGIDPVCLFHGKRRSEHVCLYCCLCFKTLTPDECWRDDEGQKWDMEARNRATLAERDRGIDGTDPGTPGGRLRGMAVPTPTSRSASTASGFGSGNTE